MIFVDAVRIYFTAWLNAFTPAGRRYAPLSTRRLLFLALAPAGILLLAVHGVCLALDEWFYPAFRRTVVRRPVFILGVPRSGTTYLHRELARDHRFATTATWELLLAPAICQRRLLGLLAAADRALGAPLARVIECVERRLATPMDSVHPVGLDAAEEDYLALLPAAGCFFTSLAFPGSRELSAIAHPGDLEAPRRERLLAHYHALLQRHLFVHGKSTLLSKNAAFASWLPYLARSYDDALFVLCVRQPASALSSQLSSLGSARKLFGTYPDDTGVTECFAMHYERWFADLVDWTESSDGNALVVDQTWMRNHGEVVLNAIYRRLDLAGAPIFPDRSGVAPENRQPEHHHNAKDWPIPEVRLQRMSCAYDLLNSRALHEVALP